MCFYHNVLIASFEAFQTFIFIRLSRFFFIFEQPSREQLQRSDLECMHCELTKNAKSESAKVQSKNWNRSILGKNSEGNVIAYVTNNLLSKLVKSTEIADLSHNNISVENHCKTCELLNTAAIARHKPYWYISPLFPIEWQYYNDRYFSGLDRDLHKHLYSGRRAVFEVHIDTFSYLIPINASDTPAHCQLISAVLATRLMINSWDSWSHAQRVLFVSSKRELHKSCD